MWVFLNNAFLSIVKHRNEPDAHMVRARLAGDIEAVFGDDFEVVETPAADYRFRATIPTQTVALALFQKALDIDYPNFKDSVGYGSERSHAYMGVWSVMHRAQTDALAPAYPSGPSLSWSMPEDEFCDDCGEPIEWCRCDELQQSLLDE